MLSLISLIGCSGDDNNVSKDYFTSPSVVAEQFIDALNRIDPQLANSFLVRDIDESERTYQPGQEEWFVIYDAKFDEYKAVSLQYIRTIVYFDYHRNSNSLAREFRSIEDSDIATGYWDGDPWGDDYEVADYDDWTDLYYGRNSGFAYEDEDQVFDVSLMQAEREEREFIQKAAALSYEYSLSVETSMSLISLGEKMQGMIHQSQGITEGDQMALWSDFEKLSGVEMGDVLSATQADRETREELLDRIAEQIGTTSMSLEYQILPEIFGIQVP